MILYTRIDTSISWLPFVSMPVYNRKASYKVDGTPIHSTLHLPIHSKNLTSLSREKLEVLLNIYKQVQLLELNERSLVDRRTLSNL